MAFDFRVKFYMNDYGSSTTANLYELGQDTLNVLGMTDDGEQIFLEYYIVSKDDLGKWIDGKLWGQLPHHEMRYLFIPTWIVLSCVLETGFMMNISLRNGSI